MTNNVAEPFDAASAVIAGELDDWNAYYRLLMAGQLNGYGGKFVVVYQGLVVAQGPDSEVLRNDIAARFGVEGHKLVVAFVDTNESIVTA
jgi:hypothetical protein